MHRKKILWLVSWYPNRNDFYDGDFIQRHARAAAIYHDVHVIFVTVINDALHAGEEIKKVTGLTEQIIYFKQPVFLGKMLKHLRWKKLFYTAVDSYIKTNGKPDVVHVHVPWKAGLVALWLKKKYRLPFIVTEHWGIYNRVAEGHFHQQAGYVQTGIKNIIGQADKLISVSNYVGNGIREMIIEKPFVVMPNVVDTSLFFLGKEKYSVFTFIHVSNMVALKNVAGIIDAFAQLIKSGVVAQMVFVGNRNNEYSSYADGVGLLNTSVFFRGEIGYADVAKEMQLANCFVLNSNIENAPCVISEALCCGLPVIATEVGGVPEMLSTTDGLLIPPNDTAALLNAMRNMYNQYSSFDTTRISEKAIAKYAYGAIARAFQHLYE